MPLNITFALSDQDLKHFQHVIDRSISSMESGHGAAEIEQSARQRIEEAMNSGLPDFVVERIVKLQVVIDMLNDEEWQLEEDDRLHVVRALAYFCEPDDLIPDEVPGLGYLDDVIYIELMAQELGAEIAYYEDFRQFRSREEDRRRQQGLNLRVQREDWLAEKRIALQAQMKTRRLRLPRKTGWRLHW